MMDTITSSVGRKPRSQNADALRRIALVSRSWRCSRSGAFNSTAISLGTQGAPTVVRLGFLDPLETGQRRAGAPSRDRHKRPPQGGPLTRSIGCQPWAHAAIARRAPDPQPKRLGVAAYLLGLIERIGPPPRAVLGFAHSSHSASAHLRGAPFRRLALLDGSALPGKSGPTDARRIHATRGRRFRPKVGAALVV